MRTLESDCDKMIKSLSNNQTVYYRITYHGDGIYNVLKSTIDIVTWKKLLESEAFNWLPKLQTYSSKNISYFTRKGYEKFHDITLPIICNYLDKESIKIETCSEMNYNIIYSDQYQVIIEMNDN